MGNYGPIAQTYDLPQVDGTVYYVAPDGDAQAKGTSLDAPATLEAVIANVKTGDAIVLRGGVYRTGNLELNQGITMQPYRDERPILKGSQVADDWEQQINGLWRTSWDHLFPEVAPDWWRRERLGNQIPPYLFNYDMVFVDGEPLEVVGWEGEVTEGTYSIDYENGNVYIGVDPSEHEIEITAFDNALTRVTGEVHGKKSDRLGPKIRGITFTQYAYRALEIEGTEGEGPTPEAEMGKDVVGTELENVTISYCSRVAGYFRGDDLVIRNCLITHTGFEGIYVISSADALLEHNIVTHTNIEQFEGVFPTAIKIFNQTHRVVVRDNLIIDNPYSSGVWYDVGNVDGQFYNNWVETTDNGFFLEISKGATVAGNVFFNCGTGIYILNSCDARIYQNTLLDSSIKIQRTSRSAANDHFGWHPATGPDVDERDGHMLANNLMVAREGFKFPLVQTIQEGSLCGELTEPQVASMAHNVYVQQDRRQPLLTWSPADGGNDEEGCSAEITELSALQDRGFGEGSQAFSDYYRPVFQSPILKRLAPRADFPGLKAAGEVPPQVADWLPWTLDHPGVPGALAPLEE